MGFAWASDVAASIVGPIAEGVSPYERCGFSDGMQYIDIRSARELR
ncbi:hypothetical protein [Streptomyces sp. 1222.5]